MMTDVVWTAYDSRSDRKALNEQDARVGEVFEEADSLDVLRKANLEQASERMTTPQTRDGLFNNLELNFLQADLNPGDALYIPEGFYHSVRSLDGHEIGINVSANWWFRMTAAYKKKLELEERTKIR